MIGLIGTVVIVAVVALALLIPSIVFLDRYAPYRVVQVFAVTATVLVCVVLAGVVVLVTADLGAWL